MPHTATSDVGLHCLQRPIRPHTLDCYGNYHVASKKHSLKLSKTCLTDTNVNEQQTVLRFLATLLFPYFFITRKGLAQARV